MMAGTQETKSYPKWYGNWWISWTSKDASIWLNIIWRNMAQHKMQADSLCMLSLNFCKNLKIFFGALTPRRPTFWWCHHHHGENDDKIFWWSLWWWRVMGDQWTPITMALSYSRFFLTPAPHPSRYSQSSFRSLSPLPSFPPLSHSHIVIILISYHGSNFSTRTHPDTPSHLPDQSFIHSMPSCLFSNHSRVTYSSIFSSHILIYSRFNLSSSHGTVFST